MAESRNPDKAALVAELATARSRLSETGAALRAALDVPSRATESFRRHRWAWLGGAALLGIVLSKLPSRRKTVFVERATGKAVGATGKLGFLWTAAKLVLGLATPVISELAGKGFWRNRQKIRTQRGGRPARQTACAFVTETLR